MINSPDPRFPPEPDPREAEALAANRRGELAPGQKALIVPRLRPVLLAGLVTGLAFVPTALCIGLNLLPMLLSEDEWLLLLVFVPMLLAFLGVGVWLGWGALRAGLALLDANAGRVEQADGRLAWTGRRYEALTEARRLPLLPGTERMPGAYRFFYLPRSRFVVGAERLFLGGTEADAVAELRRALQDEFRFVDEDLFENQSGQLSARQRQVGLWNLVRAALLWTPFAVLGLAFACVFPYLTVVRPWQQGEPLPAEAWVGGLVPLVLGLLFAVFAGATLVTPILDLLAGEVKQVRGPVDKQIITTGSGRSRQTSYYYAVEGQRFRVHAAAYNALIEGRLYRLFYLPRSKKIVGVEVLS